MVNPMHRITAVVGLAWCVVSLAIAVSAYGEAPSAARVTAREFATKPIYHSPQSPGYTAWTTLWRTPKDELRVAFQQVTGPVEDWAKRKNVTVILGSDDEGTTWKTIREVPARTNAGSQGQGIYAAPGSSAFCGHGFAVLKDGALITGLWPPAEERGKSGYVQRSTDDGLTWSEPIYFRDPQIYKTYPSQIHQLHDGRLVLVAGTVNHADAQTAKFLLKEFFESRDDGKTWSHIWTMPADVGLCEESDFVELDGDGKGGGDLLFSHRAEHYAGDKYINSTRLQNIFHRKGGGWEIGPVTEVPMPHSGFPELLKTREGSILHIATDGVWQTNPDLHTWTRLDLPASPYYPRAMQLKDGRILVVGHVGGDDEYGKVDQTIVMQTFRLDSPRKEAKADVPVDLARGPQLFIDDFLIAESAGIKKVTRHPARALDAPILGWKEHTTQPYVTVLRDAESGLFRMWYNYDGGHDTAIAYAESKDGIAWRLPALKIVGPDNRLFKIGRSAEHGSYGVSVVDDGPKAFDPQRRYKLMWWSGTSEPAGASMAFSPDGIRWTPYEGNPVIPFYPLNHPKVAIGVGDIVDLFRDPVRGRYGAMLKMQAVEADGWKAGPRAGKSYRRLIGASFSENAMHWNEPWRVITPEPRDEGLLEFYSAGGTIARGPLLISFVRMLHDDYSPDSSRATEVRPTPGLGYTTLATSRDGVHWQRHNDIFFDRNHSPGTWDHAMTWIGSAVPVGDELFLYYGGYARGHKIEPTKERQIGLVKMPIDRFVAMEPDGEGRTGSLRTIPLRLPPGADSRLVLNADAKSGRIRVQARDSAGAILPGFAFDDCAPITSDGVKLPVKWKGGSLPTGQIFQLDFELTGVKLFAFDVMHEKQDKAEAQAPAAAAPSLTDFWGGKAAWVKDAEMVGGAFGFHFPSIIPAGDELWAYYIHNHTASDGKSKMGIGRARGTDAINWTDDGMVLDVGGAKSSAGKAVLAWDDRLTSFPGVWKDGDTWYLVYEGASA